jgi:hypothetical protein
LGLGFAAAIFVDAYIIRTVLLPSAPADLWVEEKP